jgi:cytochrome c biogenesis protein CcdA
VLFRYQVYVPALILMIKSGQSAWRSAAYLGLYNLIFVMPLVILLALGCFGLRVPALVGWSRRNVTVSKTLLGLFFFGMAAIMLGLMK